MYTVLMGENGANLDHVTILYNYGKFNGYNVVLIKRSIGSYMDGGNYQTVGGQVTFIHPDTRYAIWVWKKGVIIYSLSEAYDKEMLSMEDIKVLHKTHLYGNIYPLSQSIEYENSSIIRRWDYYESIENI